MPAWHAWCHLQVGRTSAAFRLSPPVRTFFLLAATSSPTTTLLSKHLSLGASLSAWHAGACHTRSLIHISTWYTQRTWRFVHVA